MNNTGVRHLHNLQSYPPISLVPTCKCHHHLKFLPHSSLSAGSWLCPPLISQRKWLFLRAPLTSCFSKRKKKTKLSESKQNYLNATCRCCEKCTSHPLFKYLSALHRFFQNLYFINYLLHLQPKPASCLWHINVSKFVLTTNHYPWKESQSKLLVHFNFHSYVNLVFAWNQSSQSIS